MEDNNWSVWAGVTVRDGEEEVVTGEAAYGGRAFTISSKYNGRKFIHDSKDDGAGVIVNEAVYGGRALATDSKVPDRIKGRHEAYRELTSKEYIINTVRHGYNEFTDVTLVLDSHAHLCRTRF